MVPIDRGFVRSLTQCEQGDEEKGYKPVKQLLDEMNKYPDIWEVAKGIEGLISRRGVHAAGILITNDKFTELNATMRGTFQTYVDILPAHGFKLIKKTGSYELYEYIKP